MPSWKNLSIFLVVTVRYIIGYGSHVFLFPWMLVHVSPSWHEAREEKLKALTGRCLAPAAAESWLMSHCTWWVFNMFSNTLYQSKYADIRWYNKRYHVIYAYICIYSFYMMVNKLKKMGIILRITFHVGSFWGSPMNQAPHDAPRTRWERAWAGNVYGGIWWLAYFSYN